MKVRLLYQIVDYLILSIVITIFVAFIQCIIIHRVDYLPTIVGFIVSFIIIQSRMRKILISYNICIRYTSKRFMIFFALLIIYLGLLLLHLYITPIFPLNPSGDFLTYTYGAYKIHNGTYEKILETNDLPIFLAIASVYGLFSHTFNILLVGRLFVLFLNLLALIETYILSIELYREYIPEVTILFFVLINSFWFVTFFSTGLYANMLGIVFTLYLFLYIIRYLRTSSEDFMFIIIISSILAVLSHGSSVLFIFSLLPAGLYALIVFKDWKPLKIFVLSVLSTFLIILLLPSAFKNIIRFVLVYGIHFKPVSGWAAKAIFNIKPDTPLVIFLGKISPFLRDAYLYGGYLGVVITCISIFIGLYLIIHKENTEHIILFSWIVIVWFITYFLDDEWRFYLYLGYPFTLLSSYILQVFRKIKIYLENLTPSKSLNKFTLYYIIVAISLLLVILSPNFLLYIKGFRSMEIRNTQQEILLSMEWIKHSTPENSTFISVVRWEYKYLPLFTGRNYIGNVNMYPGDLIEYLSEMNLTKPPIYVIIWNKLKYENDSSNLIEYYENDTRFLKVYSNNIVTIYRLRFKFT